MSDVSVDIALAVTGQSTRDTSGKDSVQTGRTVCRQRGRAL